MTTKRNASLHLKARAGTPWGDAQTIEDVAPGIIQVTTASHGGMLIDLARHAGIPEYLQGLNRFGGGNWYEEDCEILILALAIPYVAKWIAPLGTSSRIRLYRHALSYLKRYHATAHAALTATYSEPVRA